MASSVNQGKMPNFIENSSRINTKLQFLSSTVNTQSISCTLLGYDSLNEIQENYLLLRIHGDVHVDLVQPKLVN